jgi:enoyl-CoA hydratase/carnithine racemase
MSSDVFLAERSAIRNGHGNGAKAMRYSDYKCFRLEFDSGVAFVSIDHPPINLLDEMLSLEFDKLGRELEGDESVRVVILQSALPDFFIAHSGLGRVAAASKTVSQTRSFRLTQMIGERFRNMPKVTIAKIEGRARGGGNEIALAVDMCFAATGKAVFSNPEVAIGLVPGGGATQRLPRLVGRGRALEVLLAAMISRRSWQSVTAISIERCRRTS